MMCLNAGWNGLSHSIKFQCKSVKKAGSDSFNFKAVIKLAIIVFVSWCDSTTVRTHKQKHFQLLICNS